MPFMNPILRPVVVAGGIVLGLVAVLGLPWTAAAADAPAAKQPAQKAIADRGQFVSFKDGTLTLKANSGASNEYTIPGSAKTFIWNYDENLFKPADTADTLNQAKVGKWFVVRGSNENVTIHIGARKASTVGTFVSFKNDRLLMLGKDLGESYTKKYGNQLHFNKFREDVPIYESVDGGEYELVKGAPSKVLAGVKEGTVLTIHGEGDDNITLIQIGVPKKKAAVEAPDKAPAKAVDTNAVDKVALKKETVRGEFMSFENGMLALKNHKGELIKSKIQLPENAKTFVWNSDEGRFKPVETAEAMSQLKAIYAPDTTLAAAHVDTAETMNWRKAAGAGLVVQIADDNVTIHIGEKKVPYVGHFVSFKDDFLFFRLKNPSLQFQKAYGDTVKFRMNEHIPVYESIDGGEYKRIGTPRTAFANIKEGEIVTVYHHYKTETDEFYLVLVGAKKK